MPRMSVGTAMLSWAKAVRLYFLMQPKGAWPFARHGLSPLQIAFLAEAET